MAFLQQIPVSSQLLMGAAVLYFLFLKTAAVTMQKHHLRCSSGKQLTATTLVLLCCLFEQLTGWHHYMFNQFQT
jgi:hypothetical protein